MHVVTLVQGKLYTKCCEDLVKNFESKSLNVISSGTPGPVGASLELQSLDLPFLTLSEMLESRFHQYPDRIAYHYVETTLAKKKSLTYRELYLGALQVAKNLVRENPECKPVVLLYNCDLDYIIAFFGCLLAGHPAVPAYPPTASKHFDRLKSVIEDSSATVALTSASIHSIMNIVDSDKLNSFALKIIETDNAMNDVDTVAVGNRTVGPKDIAFLQYTSGSTGDPKGVMLTHEALLANLKMIKAHYRYTSSERLAMWLPLYHDMGLISGVILAIYINSPLYFMPPQSIVRPIRWLRLLSDIRATASGGPNFSFEMCLNRTADKDLENLDLSSLRFLVTGAEPVNSSTVKKFCKKFEKYGLRRDIIVPSYGLAEVCVFAFAKKIGQPIKKISIDPVALQTHNRAVKVASNSKLRTNYVSCGYLNGNSDALVICPSNQKPVGAFTVGELLISGTHLMNGYWGKSSETKKAFIEIKGKRYLRTGDLVFFDDDMDVFFCGRQKDLIIVRGKNYYATDIEMCASSASLEIKGAVNCAFYVKNESQDEEVILIQEIPLDFDFKLLSSLETQIVSKVANDIDLVIDRVVFTRPGTVKRTSAGKVRRLATKILFQSNHIKPCTQNSKAKRYLLKLKSEVKKAQGHTILVFSKTRIGRSLSTRYFNKSSV